MSAIDSERAADALEAVSAMARTLAKDLRAGRLWEGDLARRVGAISTQLEDAKREAQKDRL